MYKQKHTKIKKIIKTINIAEDIQNWAFKQLNFIFIHHYLYV